MTLANSEAVDESKAVKVDRIVVLNKKKNKKSVAVYLFVCLLFVYFIHTQKTVQFHKKSTI